METPYRRLCKVGAMSLVHPRRLAIRLFAAAGAVALLATASVASAQETSVFTVGTEVAGVTCATSSSCIVVGETDAPGYEATNTTRLGDSIVATFDQTSTATTLASASSIPTMHALYAVACSSPTHCVATGDSGTDLAAEDPASTTFNGHVWSHAVSVVSLGTQAHVFSISCPTSYLCMGVGIRHDTAGEDVTFAARFNGRSWTVTPTPNAASGAAGDSDTLSSVSCIDDGTCVAVGNFYHDAHDYSLTEEFNGETWRIWKSPSPGKKTTQLFSVSCDVTRCIAVGYFDSTHVLVLQERDARWSAMSTPNPGRQGGALMGLDCTSVESCVAAGAMPSGSSVQPLIEMLKNGRWQLMPSPTGGDPSFLDAVSCTTASTCLAIGHSDELRQSGLTAVITPIIETLRAGRWSRLRSS
jgi:hypothetical protein